MLIVAFTIECEGRTVNRKMVDAQYDFLLDRQGRKVLMTGTRKDWSKWTSPREPVHNALSFAIYGTTNSLVGDMSNTARTISWKIEKIRRSIGLKVAKQLKTKKMTEVLTRINKTERRKEMIKAMEEVLRRYPEMLEREVLSAFEEARQIQVVREVMET